ncbi:MAG: site-specific DNA-methyltransferase [Candidatus Izemoplasmatales bacterium]
MKNKLDGLSMDIEQIEMDKLRAVFPQCFVESKLDIDKLLSLCGEYIDNDFEKYKFEWKGKSECLRIAQQRSMGTLRPCPEESVDFNATQNLYIEGDNLEVLKLLQTAYYRKVKMIYIDPPYNTGNDFVYEDDFKNPLARYKEVTGQTTKSNPETMGRYHTNWLNMMYPRLRLAANLLRDDGVIFISIDDNEVHNLRKVCDEVFGEENFVINIAWRRTDNQPNIGKFARVKEYVVCYCKNSLSLTFDKLSLTEKAKNEYRYEDKNGKFRRAILLDKTRGRHVFPIKTKSGNILTGPWMINEFDFMKLDSEGGIYWTSGGDEQPYGKIYLSESKGQIPNDFWGIEFGTNQRASLEVEALFNKRLFDFPKPVSLLKTLLSIGLDKDSIILDFFSGSATTAHAVMQLNAENGGNRKFIMVQLPELCDEKSEAYKAGYKNICEIGKERIRRAGQKIKEEAGILLGNLDIGFKVFKLDTSNLKTWDSSFIAEDELSELTNRMNDMMNTIKPDRSDLDMVYEIMLKMGIPLTYSVTKVNIGGKTAYSIGDESPLLVCLREGITTETIEQMAEEYIPSKIVLSEKCFTNDTAMANAHYVLKDRKIELKLV